MRFILIVLLMLTGGANAATLVINDAATDIHVQYNGVDMFCAAGLSTINGPIWNFTGACTVPPPALGRITSSNIAYNGCTTCGQRFVGVTEWSAIWGHATDRDVEAPFPGRANSQPSILNFTRTGYVAAHFVPSAAGPKAGWIVHTEYNYGADLSWSISTAAGDFNPANALCKGNMVLSGGTLGRWTINPTGYRSFCPVTPGVNYYLNLKLANPAQVTTTCRAGTAQCVIGTSNNYSG